MYIEYIFMINGAHDRIYLTTRPDLVGRGFAGLAKKESCRQILHWTFAKSFRASVIRLFSARLNGSCRTRGSS